MGTLVVLVLALLNVDHALSDGGEAECFVPEGAVVAEVAWRGGPVRAREGALEVHGRRWTPCDGLPGAFPSALAVSGDKLWVGFRAEGVFSFENGRFTAVTGLPADGVLALAAQGEVLWVGLGTRGLWRVEADRTQPFRHGVLGAQGITALWAEGETLHVGAGPWGWWTIEGGRASRAERGTFAGCFRAGPKGVAAIPPGQGCAYGLAAPASGLPSGHITVLTEHQKSLYIGTFDAGLARFDGAGFVPVVGAPRFINALLSQGDTLWIATARGLYRLDGDGAVRSVGAHLPSDHISALAAGRDGTVWLGTSQGLAGLGKQGVRVLDGRHGLPGRIVYAVAVADDDAIWAGTDAGVARFSADGVQVFDHARGQVPHDWVNALLPDGTSMIAGTYDAGVVVLAADGSGRPLEGLGPTWVNPAGLSRLGGRVVVATLGEGLLTATKEGALRRTRLPSADVTAALLYEGQLWVGTRGGLVRFNTTNLNELQQPKK